MTLQDLITTLTNGELVQIRIDIDAGDQPQLIRYISMGLTELYTRFPLKDGEVTIQQYDNITMYTLSSEFAESNTDSTATTKFIVDKNDPFIDDIIRVESAFNEIGIPVPLNDYSCADSLFMASYNTLQIPAPVSTNSTQLIYRANHPALDPDVVDPSTVDIELPDSLLTALLFYVGFRYHSFDMTQDAQAVSMAYYQKYIAELQMLEKLNVLNDSDTDTNIKIQLGGWV